MSWMVEKLSELGADAVVPTVFQRSLDAGVRVSTAKAARWRRTAVEAAKQCGRNILLEVKAPFLLDELLKESARFDLNIVLIPEHPGPSSVHGGPETVPSLDGMVRGLKAVPAETLVLVGPEGGISQEESERIGEAGFRTVSLGSRILRIETAALAATAVLRSAWD
jgi:16S rRNA (uracil1498-N3)-methyltransferase